MNTGDPAARPKRPKTKARLEQLITQWQKDSGYPVSRLNLRIAAMMIAGALARVVGPEGRAAFATKGGIAMELRMRGQARATNDIDLVLRGDADQLADLLDEGLAAPYEGFSFRRGEITSLPRRAEFRKVKVQVIFAGRVLSSPQLEISPAETGHEKFTAIPGLPLDAVGLDGPETVLVLDTRWQIAQKLHAVTEEYPDGYENPRFRDLVDLQLLEALEADLPTARQACEQVFTARGGQTWPPRLVAQPSWREGYAALAEELHMSPTDVETAVDTVQAFIDRIATA
ncbi:MAG: nucleotidyl transferase AbiEii/AbiGii toxin family protein [Solirubrobacterales bacterium]|nr:nucleotidyl transferase AbiEii/AbiGii toxin family protein [Solirubrobacterales bacterium]OJU95718.1 MAG: hypothetical protein BGO23_08950 [Solirubrobacterales bacterium 67-14]